MTDVAGPIREASVGRNALLSAAQVDELETEGGLTRCMCKRGWDGEGEFAMIPYASL